MTNRLTEKGKFSEPYDSKYATDCINKLGKLEDLMEKYNVNEKDIEIALITKKIIQNTCIYYENEVYVEGIDLLFDFKTNEIILNDEIEDDFDIKWKEHARLPILDYKKKYWLKEDKSE